MSTIDQVIRVGDRVWQRDVIGVTGFVLDVDERSARVRWVGYPVSAELIPLDRLISSRPGVARLGEAGLGVARLGPVRLGTARHGLR